MTATAHVHMCAYIYMCIYVSNYMFTYTGCSKNIDIILQADVKQIPVQIFSYLDSMFLNRLKFDVFIFTDIEMPFIG